jgi:hypothetical protein
VRRVKIDWKQLSHKDALRHNTFPSPIHVTHYTVTARISTSAQPVPWKQGVSTFKTSTTLFCSNNNQKMQLGCYKKRERRDYLSRRTQTRVASELRRSEPSIQGGLGDFPHISGVHNKNSGISTSSFYSLNTIVLLISQSFFSFVRISACFYLYVLLFL